MEDRKELFKIPAFLLSLENMAAKLLRVGKVVIGGKRPAFILGPCVIESEKFVWRIAREISKICRAEDVDLIFKASYDKANRTSVRSFRGLAPLAGCEILAAIGEELKIPVTTDVHSPDEAKLAAAPWAPIDRHAEPPHLLGVPSGRTSVDPPLNNTGRSKSRG